MVRTVTIILCALAMSLSACALQSPAPAAPSGSPPAAGATRIGFAALEFERPMYEPMIEAFNIANPDLQVVFVPLEPNLDGDDATDLARYAASSADTFTSMLAGPEAAASGAIADLRPLIDADGGFDRDDFQPGALPTDGPIYMLPTHLSVQTLSYNSDLWEAAGMPAPTGRMSWEQLLAAAEQLTQRRDDEVLVYGLDDGQDGRVVLQGLLVEAGVPLAPAADGSYVLDRPEVAAALERVADLLERGVLYRSPQRDGPVSMEQIGAHVREGRVAMWLGGDLLLGGPMAERPAFAVGDIALPPLPRDAVIASRGYMLSAGSANPEAAWRWLSYLSRAQPTAQNGMVIFGLGVDVPARRSLAEATGFWEGLSSERAAAIEVTLDGADALPPAGATLVRGNLGGALSSVAAGTPVEQALAEHGANLARQLAEQVAAPTPTAGPLQVQLPDAVVVPAGATAISFGAFGAELPALRELAARFNAEGRSIYVTVEPPTFDSTFSLTSLAERYDCLVWPTAPNPRERETLLDLQPLIDGDAGFDADDYPAGLLAPYRDGAALYGLPYSVQLRSLNYNRGAFAAAGLEAPRADWSLAELLEAARRLTDASGPDQRYGYGVTGSHTDDLLAFLDWQDASPIADGRPRFTDEQVVQAIGDYIELLREYSPHTRLQGYTAGTFADSVVEALGREGRVGMWFTNGFNNGQIMIVVGAGQSEQPDLAVAPPALGERGLSSADFRATAMQISATSRSPEACWEWLKFLSEQAEGLGERFPARTSVATSPAFLQQARPGAAEVYAVYAEALARPESTQDPYDGVDLFWLMRAVDNALQGGDLEQELARAETLTEQYLACAADAQDPPSCAAKVDPEYEGLGPR